MRIVDLFCGCGGMSLGFQEAGYDIAAAFDNWDKAMAVYRLNFDHPAIKLDLSDAEPAAESIMPYEPDMIIGGPPCQDFSSAGKRDEDNGRGGLTVSYAKIISLVRPKWFVMENVTRIAGTNKLKESLEIFRQSGYGLSQFILDASLCGVPQSRKRFFLVGCIGERDNFLLPIIMKNLSTRHMTMADYFGDELDFEFYYRHPRSYVRRGIFSVHEPSPTIRGVNRPMPQGYPLHPGDPVRDLSGIKALTTEQRSRVQTFPKSFEFVGNKTDREQMIGNAVPVNLAKFVASAISEYVASRASNKKNNAYPIANDGGGSLYLFEGTQPYSEQRVTVH